MRHATLVLPAAIIFGLFTSAIPAEEATGLDRPIGVTFEKTSMVEVLMFVRAVAKLTIAEDPPVYEVYFSLNFRELSRYGEKHLFSGEYTKTPTRKILNDLLKPFGLQYRAEGASVTLVFTPEKKAELIKRAKQDIADKDSEVRMAGLRLLALFDARECIPAFVERLGENWGVSQAAMWGLVRMKETDSLLKGLRQGNKLAKCRSAEGLGLLKQQAVVSEMAKLADQIEEPELLRLVIEGLIRCNAAEPVLKALRNPARQEGALWAFQEVPIYDRSTPALAQIAKTMEQAIPELTQIAKTAEKPLFRLKAIGALLKLESAAGIDAAVLACSDPSPDMREASVHMLTVIKGTGVLQALCNALADENAKVREAAKDALSERNDPGAIPHLHTLIEESPVAAPSAKELLDNLKARSEAEGKK